MEVLVSTMFQTDRSLIERLGLECDAIVVNQCDNDNVEHFVYDNHRIIWIDSSDRGLSKSRNKAISYATSDICLLVDDDEQLVEGYSSIITDAFSRLDDADVIGFQAEGIEAKFKDYSAEESKVGYVRSMRMASVEIAFRREKLQTSGIRFNESIGAGTKFKMGEENTLLFNCLSKGLKIYYVPQLICRIHIGDSTWFNGFDDEYFIAKGGVFTAMSNKWAILLIIQFAIRKYPMYKSNLGLVKACRLMLKGREDYINEI